MTAGWPSLAVGNRCIVVGGFIHTVDGKNCAPVDMVNIPLFTGFYTCQVVVGDF